MFSFWFNTFFLDMHINMQKAETSSRYDVVVEVHGRCCILNLHPISVVGCDGDAFIVQFFLS